MSANESVTPIDISSLLKDASRIGQIPASQIPALLTQLSSLQTAIASRLIVNDEEAADDADQMLTVEEAAARLGVSADWVYRRSKSLPFIVRFGRNVRCSARELDRFLKNRVGR